MRTKTLLGSVPRQWSLWYQAATSWLQWRIYWRQCWRRRYRWSSTDGDTAETAVHLRTSTTQALSHAVTNKSSTLSAKLHNIFCDILNNTQHGHNFEENIQEFSKHFYFANVPTIIRLLESTFNAENIIRRLSRSISSYFGALETL